MVNMTFEFMELVPASLHFREHSMSEMALNYENMVERSTTTITYSYIWRDIYEFALVYIAMCNVWNILCHFL